MKTIATGFAFLLILPFSLLHAGNGSTTTSTTTTATTVHGKPPPQTFPQFELVTYGGLDPHAERDEGDVCYIEVASKNKLKAHSEPITALRPDILPEKSRTGKPGVSQSAPLGNKNVQQFGKKAYEVLKTLQDQEQTGMSTVVVAKPLASSWFKNAKPVVVKTTENSAQNKGNVLAIEKEIKILQGLKHENIAALRKAIRDDEEKVVGLATELINGKDLFDYVSQKGPLSEAEIKSLGKGGAKGLAYLHSKGHAHRDVKPGKSMNKLTRRVTRKLVVIDLGLGYHDSDDDWWRPCGTGLYLAPEASMGQVSSPWAMDVYSFGVVLMFMHTGKELTVGFMWVAEVKKLKGDTDAMKEGRFSGTFLDLVSKMLAEDPTERITMADVVKHPFFK